MITTYQVKQLFESYQAKADRSYRAYQETGTQAYQWRYHRYQDIADVCERCLSFNEKYEKFLDDEAVARIILGERHTTPEQKIKQLREHFHMAHIEYE